jgi:hypothetical protein
MNGKGKLRLDFLNVYGSRLNDRVDVFLKHTTLHDPREARDHSALKGLVFPDLTSTHGGTYSVLVYPMRHRPVSRFVQIKEGQTTTEKFILPADPRKVSRIDGPLYDEFQADLQQVLQNSEVEGFAGLRGPDLYQALDDVRKAGLLNITAKMKATTFPNGRDVFSYLTLLTRLRGDRFFAGVQKELRDETKNSIAVNLFHEVSGGLHTPPPGFTLADSFKTFDRYGNLQLTFFSKPDTLEFIVDSDIDDAQGIGHVFQVLSHALTGSETHPYDIHEILLQHQRIDPGYRLVV